MRSARAFLVTAAALLMIVAPEAATSRRVTLRTTDGVTLNGMYFEPSRRPAPGIALLPMLSRTHDDWQTAGNRLADAGFAVLAIDFRNGGDAESASLELDVRAAKAFLRERPEVAASGLGLAGASIGANMTVIDAAEDPSVRSIAMLSPGLDYRGLRTEAAMKRYGSRAAWLVSSTKDPYAWRSVKTLSAIGPGTREVRLSDQVAHGTVLLSVDPDLIDGLVDWFRKTLG